jgi:hypothetical protein
MGKSKTPIDVRRVIRAAVDAALEDPVPQPRRKRRVSSKGVLLLGAGLMTAGRLAASSRGREMFDTVRHRVGGVEDRFRGSDDDLPEDEGELDEQEELDADEGEQTEAVDDEFDEGQELGDGEDDELDEDEPEPELEEDQQPSRNTPRRRRRGRA